MTFTDRLSSLLAKWPTMNTPTLFLYSSFLSFMLPLIGWTGHLDLTVGLFSWSPLWVVPSHLFLWYRLHVLGPSHPWGSIGAWDKISLYIALAAYTLGTVIIIPRMISLLGAWDLCSWGPAVCAAWLRTWIVLPLQTAGGIAEVVVLGTIVWRARYGAEEEGAVYLPQYAADENEARAFARAPPADMPININDVQVSLSLLSSGRS
jgi:hypothetical protein